MRTKFITTFFLALVLFFPFTNVFPYSFCSYDTSHNTPNPKLQNPDRNFHFSFTYGRAYFDTRTGVLSAYTESGYPYHVISRADPNEKAKLPVLYSFTIEKNLSSQIFIGLQYSVMLNQKISGSNWIGAIQNKEPIPVEQFDVEESYSSKFINGTVNCIPVLVNFDDSRLEFSIGAGISYNMLKVSGIQRYERHPNYYSAFDDTSASFELSKMGFGFLFAGSLDFYWSRNVSNQFKLEYRATPALQVPNQTFTFVTTRKRVRVTDTHTLKKHKIRYSGVVLSLAFRFHI